MARTLARKRGREHNAGRGLARVRSVLDFTHGSRLRRDPRVSSRLRPTASSVRAARSRRSRRDPLTISHRRQAAKRLKNGGAADRCHSCRQPAARRRARPRCCSRRTTASRTTPPSSTASCRPRSTTRSQAGRGRRFDRQRRRARQGRLLDLRHRAARRVRRALSSASPRSTSRRMPELAKKLAAIMGSAGIHPRLLHRARCGCRPRAAARRHPALPLRARPAWAAACARS